MVKLKIFVSVRLIKKGYCPVCGEPLEKDIGYVECNENENSFLLVPVHRKCLQNLYQLEKLRKRRKKKNENINTGKS